jgi:hypothetical protein
MMEVLNGISREELEAVFAEWLLILDRFSRQNGEYIEYGSSRHMFSYLNSILCGHAKILSDILCLKEKMSSSDYASWSELVKKIAEIFSQIHKVMLICSFESWVSGYGR